MLWRHSYTNLQADALNVLPAVSESLSINKFVTPPISNSYDQYNSRTGPEAKNHFKWKRQTEIDALVKHLFAQKS